MMDSPHGAIWSLLARKLIHRGALLHLLLFSWQEIRALLDRVLRLRNCSPRLKNEGLRRLALLIEYCLDPPRFALDRRSNEHVREIWHGVLHIDHTRDHDILEQVFSEYRLTVKSMASVSDLRDNACFHRIMTGPLTSATAKMIRYFGADGHVQSIVVGAHPFP